MLNIVMDAAPSPQVLLYVALGFAGIFVVIGLITISIIMVVKAIKKKKQISKEETED